MKININRDSTALTTLALLGMTHNASAQTYAYYPNNATISSSIMADNTIVGYSNFNDYLNQTNGTSPTLNVVSGANLSGALSLFNSSVANISGGIFGDSLFVYDSTIANVSGGTAAAYFIETNGLINFYGTGLSANLVDPDSRGQRLYSLSGTLADGTILSNVSLYVGNNSNAKYTFNPGGSAVPEPGSILLLVGMVSAGAGALRRKRRCVRLSGQRLTPYGE